MPTIAVQVSSAASGHAEVKIMECHPGIVPRMIVLYLNSYSRRSSAARPSMSKGELKELLSFTQSQRECEIVAYTAFKASDLSATAARRHFGLQNIGQSVSYKSSPRG